MRGKDGKMSRTRLKDGITPAYAGKSGWPTPRTAEEVGSPPRMRGKENG